MLNVYSSLVEARRIHIIVAGKEVSKRKCRDLSFTDVTVSGKSIVSYLPRRVESTRIPHVSDRRDNLLSFYSRLKPSYPIGRGGVLRKTRCGKKCRNFSITARDYRLTHTHTGCIDSARCVSGSTAHNAGRFRILSRRASLLFRLSPDRNVRTARAQSRARCNAIVSLRVRPRNPIAPRAFSAFAG